MTRAYDFTLAGVLSIFSVILHRIGIAMFDTDTPLYAIATDGTATLNGAEKAAMWSEFFILWLPLLIFATGWLYALIREYRRQAITAQRQVGP